VRKKQKMKYHEETGWRRNSTKRKFNVENEVQQKRRIANKRSKRRLSIRRRQMVRREKVNSEKGERRMVNN